MDFSATWSGPSPARWSKSGAADGRWSRCAKCWTRANVDGPVRPHPLAGCSSSASSTGTYNVQMSLEQLLAGLPGSPGSPDEALARQIDFDRLPAHIAIIMDGNGRWAAQRHL